MRYGAVVDSRRCITGVHHESTFGSQRRFEGKMDGIGSTGNFSNRAHRSVQHNGIAGRRQDRGEKLAQNSAMPRASYEQMSPSKPTSRR